MKKIFLYLALLSSLAGYSQTNQYWNGKKCAVRRMNGDQDHQGRHVRIPVNDYSIQHVKLYTY